MALGGGIYTAQNKVLPGYYVNFSSAGRVVSALADRGVVAMPLSLNWGPTGTVFTVTCEDFLKNSMKIFGYAQDAPELLAVREIFKNARVLHAYRTTNGGTAASNSYATAKHSGTRGNDLKIVIARNVDDTSLFDVSTYLGSILVDRQTVASAAGLVDNDYVSFTTTATLSVTAGTALTNGANGSAVTGSQYQDFLDKIEAFSFNALGCPTADATTIGTFVAFTRRLRDEVGAKFKLIAYRTESDYEGVINVQNSTLDYPANALGLGAYGLVYWVTGAEAGCQISRSNTNKLYDGELTVDTDYTQAELEAFIAGGKYTLHNVNRQIRVLSDINSRTTLTDDKGADFQSNQTVRICDQIANDIATVFATRYLGSVPNDAAGRMSLWNDICKQLQSLETIRAIENFDASTVSVEPGDTKASVACNISGLQVINAMSQLYMSVVVA